jgi:two-component system, OmpR family, response regulator
MQDNFHVLMVDDDLELGGLVAEYLSDEGYRVSLAHNAADMRRISAQSAVDVVLLDVVLPGEDGLSLVRALRAERPELPIIMLTGRGETIDRIIGLEMGADDYLSKPFHLRELLARVKSVTRRTLPTAAAAAAPQAALICFAGWELDRARRLLLSPAGEEVRLTSGEFDLLVAFVTNPGEVLSRDRLLDLSRDRKASPFDRTIDVQVGRLRRKLEKDPQRPQLLKTVRGGGYMFAAAVDLAAGSPRYEAA